MSYDLKVQKHTRRSLWVAIAPVNGARDRRQCEVSTNSMSVENRTEVDVEAAEKPPAKTAPRLMWRPRNIAPRLMCRPRNIATAAY